MRRISGILFLAALIAFSVGSVFAEEHMEKTEKEEKSQSHMMMHEMHGMMDKPMMQKMMGGQGMMGDSGKMGMEQMPMMGRCTMGGQGMMCPKCGSMTKGMIGGQGCKGMMKGMTGGMMPDITGLVDKLDLSKEQIADIKGILTSHKKHMIRKNADREIAEIDLHELAQQEEPNLDAIEEQVKEIANLDAQIKFSQIKVWIDAKSILTEEQKMALKKIMKEQEAPSMCGKKGKGKSGKHGSGGCSGHCK